MHLGYIYHPSPIVVPDGTPKPADDTFGYEPTAFPGARAPHVWLARTGRSSICSATASCCLKFDDAPTEAIERAAAGRGVPLTVQRIENREAAALYGRRLVLVRPDGHVAWRGDAAPRDPLALIDTVRGAGPRIAARRAPATSASAP